MLIYQRVSLFEFQLCHGEWTTVTSMGRPHLVISMVFYDVLCLMKMQLDVHGSGPVISRGHAARTF